MKDIEVPVLWAFIVLAAVLIIVTLFVSCTPHHARVIPAGGLQDNGDGTFSAGVRSVEDLQTVLLLNNCGLGKVCTFQDVGLTNLATLPGDVHVIVALVNARSHNEFMKTLGCKTIFICATDGKIVSIEGQVKQ